MNYISNREQIRIYIGKFWRTFKNTKGWQALVMAAVITTISCVVIGKEGLAEDFFLLDFDATLLQTSFILTSVCVWVGLFNSITLICKERDIIKHEYREGMNLSSYISAHLIFQAFLAAMEALVVFGVVFLFYSKSIAGFDSLFGNDLLRFLSYYLTFFLIILAADSLGLLISSLVKTVEQAMTITPFVLLLQLVLSGNMKLEGFLKPLSYLMVGRYGVDSFLRLMDLSESRVGDAIVIPVTWVVLLAFTVLYAYLATRFLKSVEHDKRS